MADQVAEPGAKRTQTLVADGETDFRDRHTLARQQTLSAIHAQAGEKVVRRLAEGAGEEPVVVIRRETRFPRRICQTERLIEPFRNVVPRAAEAAEQLIVHERPEPVRGCHD